MVDLTPFRARIQQAIANATIEHTDPMGAFLGELEAAGFETPKILTIGKLHRIDDPQDKQGQKTGWCIYNQHTLPDGRLFGVGTYGSWRGSPEKVTWTSKSQNALTFAERMEMNRQIEVARLEKEAEQARVWTEKAELAAKIWENATLPKDNAYLSRKGIQAHGIRESRGDLVIPVTIDGSIASVQFIRPDGGKKFLTGGRVKGGYYKLQGTDETAYIAEGYATAASIYEATGASVYVAFNAGNIYEVAAAVKDSHQKVVICADMDAHGHGQAKAEQASAGLGMEVAYPVGHKDFNDWHVADGLEAVRNALQSKPETYKTKERQDAVLNPTGALGDIVSYYHATSGNDQPGFAVQAAIATCSVILARNFETNWQNRAGLYLLNLGKSGTGKEHAKRVLENILYATGNDALIAGDGYTSSAAVFSALCEKPRHVTVIDEFSKYLQASMNKYSNSHQAEANSSLMQVFGRQDGTIRPKSYSTIGLAEDKKKQITNQYVEHPSITLLAMSTPDDLFQTLGMGQIKDGFINRFLICISDAKRERRKHKEKLEVPQKIIDWCMEIKDRIGDVIESPKEKSTPHLVSFLPEAMEAVRDFEDYCIENADKLEQFGMSEIPARYAEISMRLSLIVALSRDPKAETIIRQDSEWATQWVRHNMERLIGELKLTISSSEHEAAKKEILKALRQSDGVTWTQMQKKPPFSKHKQKDLREILNALRDADLAFDEPYASGGKGRPTVIWRAAE